VDAERALTDTQGNEFFITLDFLQGLACAYWAYSGTLKLVQDLKQSLHQEPL